MVFQSLEEYYNKLNTFEREGFHKSLILQEYRDNIKQANAVIKKINPRTVRSWELLKKAFTQYNKARNTHASNLEDIQNTWHIHLGNILDPDVPPTVYEPAINEFRTARQVGQTSREELAAIKKRSRSIKKKFKSLLAKKVAAMIVRKKNRSDFYELKGRMEQLQVESDHTEDALKRLKIANRDHCLDVISRRVSEAVRYGDHPWFVVPDSAIVRIYPMDYNQAVEIVTKRTSEEGSWNVHTLIPMTDSCDDVIKYIEECIGTAGQQADKV